MKKRFVYCLFICLLLAGCHREAPPFETTLSTAVQIPETSLATQATEETFPVVTVPIEIPTLPVPEPAEDSFVDICEFIPEIYVELKYASEDNFTGQVIYDFSTPYLRYGTVKKLIKVQEELGAMGLYLKIWDGFRPVSAQFTLWEVYPDPTYVANPTVGYSSHSRGNTVDLTVVDERGRELVMPTGFDDFTSLADRNYSDCGDEEAANAKLLQDIMEKHGFSAYFGEWWHYSDTQQYPVETCFDPGLISTWYADCMEFISLRQEPDIDAAVITRILANEEVTLLGYDRDFAMVDYCGQRGYVLKNYLAPIA